MEKSNEKSKLEEIRRKLYSKHYEPVHSRAKLSSEEEYEIKDDWDEEVANNNSQTIDLSQKNQTEEIDYWGPNADLAGFNSDNEPKEIKKFGPFKIILIIASIFFISSIAYAFFIFNQGSQSISSSDVNINVIGPVSVGGGQKLSLDVVIQNNNNITLELVDLIIEYPEGTKRSDDLVTNLPRERIPLGNIEAGSIARKTITAALFGRENSTQEITVSIEYRLDGSNAIFEKKKPFDIVLSASPVRLVVNGLREISSGQKMEITAKLASNSTKTLENVMVTAEYPFGFEYESSNIAPTINENIWVIKKLEPSEEKEIVISGYLAGQNEEDRTFRFHTGIQNEQNSNQLGISWGTVLYETTIKEGFASLNMQIEGKYGQDITVKSGKRLEGVVYFYNNTSDTIRDIEITMKIDGEVLDEKSVIAREGFYRSSDNTIVWNKETKQELFKSLGPKESYELNYSFSSIDMSRGSQISRPEINITLKADALRVSENEVEESITADTSTKIALLSDIDASIYTAYGDGPLNNVGPIPPVAEEHTTYTIVFEVANGSNELENARFETTLPSYVTWERVVNPSGAKVSYNESTREVVWLIGDLQSGIGYQTPTMKMFASVTLNPSLSQVGDQVELTRNSKIVGFDTFAKETITQEVNDATTKIYNRTSTDQHSVVVVE